MLPHSALRCRLNTTLSPIQPLLKFGSGGGGWLGVCEGAGRERNPLFLTGFGSVPGGGSCVSFESSNCFLVHLCSLEDSHLNRGGMVLLKLVRSEKIKAQGRTALAAGVQQNQPLCNDCAAGFPVGKLISPPEVMTVRKTTDEERTWWILGWMLLCCG